MLILLPEYSVESPEALLLTQSASGLSTRLIMRDRMITSAQHDKSFLRFQQELTVPHDLLFIDPNIELPTDNIDVSA